MTWLVFILQEPEMSKQNLFALLRDLGMLSGYKINETKEAILR